MKTKLFFIAAITAMLFTCQTLQAQVKYGVHAAANLETQADFGQLWNNCDLYQGFLVGGFLEYKAGNNLAFQTELNYQKKGAKFTSTEMGTESVVRRTFNYMTVPLLVKSTFHDTGLGENWDLALFTGPYLSYLTSANSNLRDANNASIDIENQAEKTDWGFIFGGGVTYKLANGGAIIGELRYQMGLKKIDKVDTDLRNKGMGITIGYRF